MAEVYLTACRESICCCHTPESLCECVCALCKSRRWQRVTERKLERRTASLERMRLVDSPQWHVHEARAGFEAARAQREEALPLRLSTPPTKPSNRELAERALASNPTPPSSPYVMPARSPTSTPAATLAYDAVPSSNLPSRPVWLPFSSTVSEWSPRASSPASLRLPSPDAPPGQMSVDAARIAPSPPPVRVLWPSVGAQLRARELHEERARTEAEAQLAVNAARAFMDSQIVRQPPLSPSRPVAGDESDNRRR